MGTGCDTCKYVVTRAKRGLSDTDGISLIVDISSSPSIGSAIQCYKKYGIYQFNILIEDRYESFFNGRSYIIRGATIQGVTLGDTTTYTRVVSVDQPALQAAAVFSTKAPNPFSETVSLDFSLDVSAAISLEVVNTKGQVVAVFPQGTLGQGKHTFRWNGKTNDGSDTEQGAYLVRMVVNGKNTDTAKLMKVR
jgi:hypothetical protein